MLLESILIAGLVGVASPVQTGWRPIGHPVPIAPIGPSHPTISYQSHIPETPEDGCTLYKAILDQDAPAQYLQFKTPVPDMKEFTLCMWHKFYNHSRDQPLFSYSSGHGRLRDIYSWVSNSDRQSFYMISVMGHTLYRLNYPIRLHKWYHLCQSWNGRTGEWQIWINSERIGRGFHNLLVGKIIKGGGTAISGQEPGNNAGGGYLDPYKPVSGLLGEVTLVQLYKAALTAGKAYTNHKHHHAHHFHHDDKLEDDDYRIIGIDPEAMREQSQQNPEYPFTRNGQLIPSLPVHELSAFRSQQDQFNPQLNILSPSPYVGRSPDPAYSLQHMRIYKREQIKDAPVPTKMVVRQRVVRKKKSEAIRFEDDMEDDDFDEKVHMKRETEKISAPAVEEEVEEGSISNLEREKRSEEESAREVKEKDTEGSHKRDKRSEKKEEEKKEVQPQNDWEKRSGKEPVKEEKEEVMKTEETANMKNKRETDQDEKVQKKRTAYIGGDNIPFGVIPGADLSGLFAGDGYILGQGGLRFSGETPQQVEKEQVQMEPAEWEVRSIMAVCSGCSEDPFRKASIVSWRETPKKLYSGVLYIPAVPECQRF